MDFKTTLQELTSLYGISGQEDDVRNYILNAVKPYADEVRTDNLGNVIVFKKGKKSTKSKIMFSAHMDEVGFIVTGIEDDGMLSFANVGGIMASVATARPVVVGEKHIPGVIGCKPTHMLSAEEESKYDKLNTMRIDIGAEDKKEAEKYVSLGDPIYFYSEYLPLGGENFCVKSIDDRFGCAAMLEILKDELPCDLTFAFTVAEEVGCIGSRTAAFAERPDIAIIMEGTTAGDIPDVEGGKRVCLVGNGPVISFMDKGTVYDHKLYTYGMNVAKENNIPCQTKTGIYGGNDSRSYQSTAFGTKVMAISLPVRYIHSATSVANYTDAENTIKLMRALIAKLAEDDN